MRGYKSTEVGDIPVEWELKRLGDIVDNFDKKRKPINGLEREKIKGEYPYCGANGIVDYINSYILDGDYVLLAEDGGYWGKGEKSSYLMKGKFWVNNHAHIIAAKAGLTTNDFLTFILNFLDIDPFIGGDARGKLTQAIMNSLLIPLPPIQEQQNIAFILSTIQSAIETQEKIIQATIELKKALMQKLFTEGLNGEVQKDTEIGRIPKSWGLAKVKDFTQEITDYVANGSFASLKQNVKYQKNKDYAILLRLTDHSNNYKGPFVYVNKEAYDFLSKSKLQPGDIVISNVGARLGTVFKAPNLETPMTLGPNAILIRAGKDDDFIYYWFHSAQGQKIIKSITTISAQPKFNKTDIRNSLMVVPPEEERKAIADVLLTIDRKLQKAKEKYAVYEVFFKSMLHHLMTGQIRVKDTTFS